MKSNPERIGRGKRYSTLARTTPSVADVELLCRAQTYLIQRAQRMSPGPDLEAAWTAFYERYSRKIREFVSSCEAPDDDVADCIQEVWAELLVRLPTYRLGARRGEFDSWLYHIVRGKTGDLHRSQSRRLLQDDSGKLRTAIDSHPNPGQRLGKTDMFAFAWDELRKKVSERNLKILQMRLVEERSVEEVAEKLQISREQVWYRYQRTRREIKEMGPVLRRPRGVSVGR